MIGADSNFSHMEQFMIEFLISGVSAAISKTIASPI